MYRSLALIMYGSETFHTKVRTILHDHIAANKEEFRKYVSGEIEAHLAKLTEIGRWGTHVELKAAAGIMKLPIYVFTPTLKADKQYAWNKIVPCSTCVHSPSPDTDVVCDRLKDLCISHVELSHTKGIHYDVIVCVDGSYPEEFPEHTFCM